MAKKAKAKKAKKATKAALVVTATHLKHAAAIVAEVTAHFGAGYATQRNTEGTAMNLIDPVFATHSDFLVFQQFLIGCTSRNLARRRVLARAWAQPGNATRAQVTLTAFRHGELARQQVASSGTTGITSAQVMATLATVKGGCPSGQGGGDICHG